MTTTTDSRDSETKLNNRWKRDEVVFNIVNFEQAAKEISQRKFAEIEGALPRTTLQYWLQRKKELYADPVLVNFFESPVGLAFLHRLISAVHYEFVENGVASIHNVSNFLKLSKLSQFVASSYGVHQKIAKNMDNMIIEFDKSERRRLSANMPTKKINLCEDETFHPEICLVAIEPVSNFIILEKYASDRKADTWNKSVKSELSDLPIEVIQCASDEASGLIKHAKEGLKANHSSDFFHVTYEIGKGTSGALASSIKQAEKEVQKAEEKVEKVEGNKAIYEGCEKRPVGRRPAFEKKIAEAQEEKKQAEENLKKAIENQETVKAARKEMGQVYHPYDPLTGTKQDAAVVVEKLTKCFERINKATEQLSDKCKKHVEKAFRVVKNMRVTIAFFFSIIYSYVENIEIPSEVKVIIFESLIPGYYLQYVSKKEKDLKRREMIKKKSEDLLSILYERGGVLSGCSDAQLCLIEKTSKACAQLFQRSSSCVEGRNAQLSLRHHSIHRLSERKLQALTAIHNYYTKRSDGTTAAERLFGNKPKDMFEWLVEHMDLPIRPRNSFRKTA